MASSEYDRFVSEVTSEIWNKMIHQSPFHSLQPAHFADLFEAVQQALTKYRISGKKGILD